MNKAMLEVTSEDERQKYRRREARQRAVYGSYPLWLRIPLGIAVVAAVLCGLAALGRFWALIDGPFSDNGSGFAGLVFEGIVAVFVVAPLVVFAGFSVCFVLLLSAEIGEAVAACVAKRLRARRLLARRRARAAKREAARPSSGASVARQRPNRT